MADVWPTILFNTIFTARSHYAVCTVTNHCYAISVLTRSKYRINIIYPRASTIRNLLSRGLFLVHYNLNHFKYMANSLFSVQTLASRDHFAMYTWQILLMFFVFLCAAASPIRIASSLGPLTLWNRLPWGRFPDPYNLNFFKSRVYPRFPNIPIHTLVSRIDHAVYTGANLMTLVFLWWAASSIRTALQKSLHYWSNFWEDALSFLTILITSSQR